MIDWAFLAPLGLTLKVAICATASAFVFAVWLADALTKRKMPGRDWLDALAALPLVLPPTVIGYYLIVVVGRRGFLGRWLYDSFGVSLMFTWQGAVLASSIVSFPLIYRTARAAFEGVDLSFENAARTLGASEWQVFWRVRLPLAWRGIVAGTMLAFARGMGEFGATLMIAGNLPGKTQTLSLAIYDAVQAGRDDDAAFLVILTSIVCVLLLVGSSKLFSR